MLLRQLPPLAADGPHVRRRVLPIDLQRFGIMLVFPLMLHVSDVFVFEVIGMALQAFQIIFSVP